MSLQDSRGRLGLGLPADPPSASPRSSFLCLDTLSLRLGRAAQNRLQVTACMYICPNDLMKLDPTPHEGVQSGAGSVLGMSVLRQGMPATGHRSSLLRRLGADGRRGYSAPHRQRHHVDDQVPRWRNQAIQIPGADDCRSAPSIPMATSRRRRDIADQRLFTEAASNCRSNCKIIRRATPKCNLQPSKTRRPDQLCPGTRDEELFSYERSEFWQS